MPGRSRHSRFDLVLAHRPHLRLRGSHPRRCHRGRNTIGVHDGDHGFADAERREQLFEVVVGLREDLHGAEEQKSAPADAPGESQGRDASADRIDFPEESGGSGKKSAKNDNENLFSQVVKSSAFKQFTRTAAREIACGNFGTSRLRRGYPQCLLTGAHPQFQAVADEVSVELCWYR